MIQDYVIKAKEDIVPQTTQFKMVMNDVGYKRDHDDNTDTSDDDDDHKKHSRSTRTRKTHSQRTRTHSNHSRTTRVRGHESDDSDTDDDDDHHHKKHSKSTKSKKTQSKKTRSHQSRTTRVHSHESDDSDDSDDEHQHNNRQHTRTRTDEHHKDQLKPTIAPTLITKTLAARDLGGMGIPEMTSAPETDQINGATVGKPCIGEGKGAVGTTSSDATTCMTGGVLGLVAVLAIIYKLVSHYRSRRQDRIESSVYYSGLSNVDAREMEESRGTELNSNVEKR